MRHFSTSTTANAHVSFVRSAVFMVAGVAIIAGHASSSAESPLSLAGQWQFRLDPKRLGHKEKWWEADLPDKVVLPGSTDENERGTPNRRPADLKGLSRLFEYCGSAWYQRDVEIPDAWRGKQITLLLERCHWETQVWLDERYCGMADSMSVAHVHDLGQDLRPGKHRLTIHVDNTIKYNLGPHAHSTSEHTQTNWNGVVGRIELQATDPLWIRDVQVYPDVDKKSAKIRVRVGNRTGTPQKCSIALQAEGEAASGRWTTSSQCAIPAQPSAISNLDVELDLSLGDSPRLWDEFSPALYDLTVTLSCDGYQDRRHVRFGMRKLAVENKQLVLNNRKIFLRGTLECCVFPLTGYPAMDVDAWLRILRICRSYGLNHLRFHSWCPPEAAFEAADRMGFLIQIEAPTWVYDWGYDPPRDRFVEEELKRILDAYGNHPSFGLMTMGNEPLGDMLVLDRLVRVAREQDSRHLYATGSGRAARPADQFCVDSAGRGVKGPATTYDLRNVLAASPKPMVSHEIGQWTVYPNLEEISKYTGVLRAQNFERIREDLAQKGLLGQAADFLRASGLWSAELYKEEIEIMLRTPSHGGFQMIDLHDFPGQGTALAGVLDAFWNSKGLISPKAFRRFCGPTVPLVRIPRRTYATNETFSALVEVAHYGPVDLPAAKAIWTIKDFAGHIVATGSFAPKTLATGELASLGKIEAMLSTVAAPTQLSLAVTLDGTSVANDWNFWVYPSTSARTPGDVMIATTWPMARAALFKGKSVLLTGLPSIWWPWPGLAKFVPSCFTTVQWSPIWCAQCDSRSADGTMGILCDPKHPAFAQFPTAMHTDWQWHEPIGNSMTMVMDELPSRLRPIVQVVDNFTKNRRLGLIFEVRVGKGKLVVSAIDLTSNMTDRLTSCQLLTSMLHYMQSDAFQPAIDLDVAAMDRYFSTTAYPPRK